MLIYLHATNQHPRLNHLGEMNQKPKKGIFTLSHPCVAVPLGRVWQQAGAELCQAQDKFSYVVLNLVAWGISTANLS